MIVTLTFDTSDVDENAALKRAVAAEEMTSYIYNVSTYMQSLSKRGDFDEDGYRMLDLIIGEMEHERTALVDAALDTWV